MRRAVYAGSFDPITNGHLWMIETSAKLFDELIVAIGINPDKKYTFTIEERLAMLGETAKNYSNVTVSSFEGKYQVKYAKSMGANYILRGLRDDMDFRYEKAMSSVNMDIESSIETVSFFPPDNLAKVSSSMVKGLIGFEGWEEIVKKYVPEPVFRKIVEKYGKKQ